MLPWLCIKQTSWLLLGLQNGTIWVNYVSRQSDKGSDGLARLLSKCTSFKICVYLKSSDEVKVKMLTLRNCSCNI